MTHEIVTVGDPLLSSGLRSIGSRRPSAPPLSLQPLRSWAPAPGRAGPTSAHRHSTSSAPSLGPSPEHDLCTKPAEQPLGPAAAQSNPAPPGPQKPALAAGGGRSESLCLESGPSGGPAPAKAEKTKLLNPKDPAVSPGNVKVGSPLQSTPGSEPNPSKTGKLPEPPAGLFSPKELHPRAPKKELEQQADLVQPEKACAREEPEAKPSRLSVGSHRPPSGGKPVPSVGKDRRPKGKKGMKERHSGQRFPSPSFPPSNSEEGAEPEALASEPGNLKHCNSVAVEKAPEGSPLAQRMPRAPLQSEAATSKDLQASQKRTVKVTLTPLKMGGESQSRTVPREVEADSQARESKPASLGQPGSGAVAQEHPSSALVPEPQSDSYQGLPAPESNLLLQEGAKAQEDGAYKRRYPRRSARARSNMFFGLTPLYGVRSYGEEDLPFYSNSTGKKRGKRSADGQVDGADDLSSSDEDDLYYYDFARTVVSSSEEHRLFREEEPCGLPRISQLDGVDDGTESDTSITVATRKGAPTAKRGSKENGTDSLKLDRSEEGGEKAAGTKGSAGHKAADSKLESGRAKAQGPDPLEAQLSSLEAAGRRARASTPSEKTLLDTFNTELLKSDSDNNNSDDCGNILPSDIMDFVLKNTPSMQALGESPESSSSELLTLGEGLGLDSNRGKDMGLFEVFSQQLPTAEPVDSSVSSSISAEEQFELPLELPSDLSVLTTRSPAVPSQNHGRMAVIAEASLSSSGERALLALPSREPAEKRVTVTEKPASGEEEPALIRSGVAPSPEGRLAADPFIQGHMEAEHIASTPCGAVEPGHGASQDLPGNGGAPGLPVPVSPTLPLQSPKFGPNSTDPPGPAQISSTAVQTAPLHLKAAAEKLLVVNQNMQPLYVLQTLPNGVTQKIQLTSSVGSAQGVMEAGAPVLGPLGSSMALAGGLSPSLSPSQPLFPPASKGLLPLAHHQHLHPFPAAPQGSFPPALGSPPAASGLVRGVQQPPDPEANPRADLGSAAPPPAAGLSKKRPIARLQSRKNKKLAPSTAPPPEAVPNVTLINFTPPSLPSHQGLLDLGAVNNTGPPRTVPNIIKRSKSGVVYFEQASLLPQGVGAATGATAGMAGPETGHPPAGPTSATPVLSVVSMQASTAPSSVPGHVLARGSVALAGPGLQGVPDMGAISSLLIKATQQSLGLAEQRQPQPSPGSRMFAQLGAASPTPPAAAVKAAAPGSRLLPPAQTTEPEGPYQPQPRGQILAPKAGTAPPLGDLAPPPLSRFPSLVGVPGTAAPEPSKVACARSAPRAASSASPGSSPSTDQPPGSGAGPASATKVKVKRLQPSPDGRGLEKKHRTSPLRTDSSAKRTPPRGASEAMQDSGAG